MNPNSRSQRLRRLLSGVVLTLLLSSFSTIVAQEETPDPSKAKGKVIGRVWHSQVNGLSLMNYVQNVGKDIGLPRSPIMMLAGGIGSGASMLGNAREVELKGTMIFLETFPNPGTPHFISFRKVEDQKEFEKIVQAEVRQMGPMGELIGEGDKLEVQMHLNRIRTLTDGQTPAPAEDGEERSFRIEIRSEVRLGDAPAEPTGQPEIPDSFSTFYRYHDGVMYSGQMKSLHFVDLPTSDSMLPAEKFEGNDIHGVFELGQVPKHLKQALWVSLKAETETYMQRFDNEATGDHALRHVVGQGRLELLKAAMFDIDTAEFSIRFASDSNKDIRASVRLEAGKSSRLAETLQQLNRTPSRLGVLREESSPFVLSTTFDLPEWTQPIATEFVDSVKAKMQAAAPDEAVNQMIGELFAPIMRAAESRDLDAAIRMEGDFESGMVLAGGLRLPDSEEFQTTLETLLLLKSGEGLSAGRTTIGDSEAIHVSLESVQPAFAEAAVPVQLFFVGRGSYLWFAVGGDNAGDVLAEQLQSEENVLNAQVRAMPLMVRMKLSQWFGENQDGVSRLPSQMVTALEKGLADIFSPMFGMSVMVNGSSIQPKKQEFSSYAKKLLTAETSDLEVRLETSGRSLSLNAEIGTGVARFLVAQYAAAQNRMFSNLNFSFDGADVEGGSVRSIRIGSP